MHIRTEFRAAKKKRRQHLFSIAIHLSMILITFSLPHRNDDYDDYDDMLLERIEQGNERERERALTPNHTRHSTAQHSSQQTFSKFHDSTQHLQNSLQTKPVDINRIHIYFIKCSIALSNHA